MIFGLDSVDCESCIVDLLTGLKCCSFRIMGRNGAWDLVYLLIFVANC